MAGQGDGDGSSSGAVTTESSGSPPGLDTSGSASSAATGSDHGSDSGTTRSATGEGETDVDDSGTTGGRLGDFEACFVDQFVNPIDLLPDYDQFDPVIGEHCLGTHHQEIEGVERVVFLGDSVTVGSRPTLPQDAYRARLADMLRDQMGLSYGDGLSETLWKTPDPFNGQSVQLHSGDFSSCAEWGARNDDLLPPGTQLEQCFTEEQRDLVTLVVMTSGGNDLSRLAQDAIEGVPSDELWASLAEFVELHRDAVEWLREPGRFPNGVFVVFANLHEFTDGTGNLMSCPAAGLAGFDRPVPDPAELIEMVVWANEQYMSTAVDTGTDMMFMLETFCGHGFANNDPAAPCYRGPDSPRYMDATCIHPSPLGHQVLADNFSAVISPSMPK